MIRLLPFLLLFSCVRHVPIEEPVSAADMVHSVVALVTPDGHAYCSGVLVPQGVLTAAHCVAGDTSVAIGLYEDYNARTNDWHQSIQVLVLKVNLDLDLALLDYKRPAHTLVAARTPDLGAQVTIIGAPAGWAYTAHHGHVSTMTRHWEHSPIRWFGVDAGILGGMSGGPVFDQCGQVAGIVSFVLVTWYVPQAHLGGAVPAEDLHTFLQDT